MEAKDWTESSVNLRCHEWIQKFDEFDSSQNARVQRIQSSIRWIWTFGEFKFWWIHTFEFWTQKSAINDESYISLPVSLLALLSFRKMIGQPD